MVNQKVNRGDVIVGGIFMVSNVDGGGCGTMMAGRLLGGVVWR